MKKFYVGLVLALVFTGCGGSVREPAEILNFNPDIQVQSSDMHHLYSNVTSTQPLESRPYLFLFKQTQVWDTPNKTNVEINYPYLQENTDDALAFNNYVRDLVADEVSSFLSQLPDSVSEDWSDMANELSVSGQILAITPNFISVDFAVSPYFAGAAHPGLYYRTVNFDLDARADWGPNEIFIKLESGLPVVQEKAIPRLVDFLNESVDDIGTPFSAADEWIQDGTAPTSTNYMNIALTWEGLRVQFDPYQVAAYTFGAPYVTIPFSELDAVLNPNVLARTGLVR